MSKKSKRVWISEGERCPKCGMSMQRYKHHENWKPKPNQPYCFLYWDVCTPCRHTQHYESAKLLIVDDKPESEAEELKRLVEEQLRDYRGT